MIPAHGLQTKFLYHLCCAIFGVPCTYVPLERRCSRFVSHILFAFAVCLYFLLRACGMPLVSFVGVSFWAFPCVAVMCPCWCAFGCFLALSVWWSCGVFFPSRLSCALAGVSVESFFLKFFFLRGTIFPTASTPAHSPGLESIDVARDEAK